MRYLPTLKPNLFTKEFLVSGTSYDALHETLFALALFDSPLSESKVIQNWCKRSLRLGLIIGMESKNYCSGFHKRNGQQFPWAPFLIFSIRTEYINIFLKSLFNCFQCQWLTQAENSIFLFVHELALYEFCRHIFHIYFIARLSDIDEMEAWFINRLH